MGSIQLSLFGRTSWELLYREIGWILEPSSNPSVAPAFQCLSLNGQMQEWCEGGNLNFLGESWMPNISENLSSCKEEREYLLSAILEDFVPTKYYIRAKTCSKILSLSETSKIRIPYPIEDILDKAGRQIPNIRPFQDRKMRGGAKKRNKTLFRNSFGKSNEPFPTLLASNPIMFAYWENGKEEEGFIRYLTPVECERLMGLPDNYTKYGADGNIILDSARYKALGNAIALPCVEYIMAGIKEELPTLVQNEQKLE